MAAPENPQTTTSGKPARTLAEFVLTAPPLANEVAIADGGLIGVSAVEPASHRQTMLSATKTDPHFTRSLEVAKTHFTPSRYVQRPNPFQALYDACGDGIHELSDEECIDRTQVIRLVSTKFADHAAAVLSEDRKLHAPVGELTNPTSD